MSPIQTEQEKSLRRWCFRDAPGWLGTMAPGPEGKQGTSPAQGWLSVLSCDGTVSSERLPHCWPRLVTLALVLTSVILRPAWSLGMNEAHEWSQRSEVRGQRPRPKDGVRVDTRNKSKGQKPRRRLRSRMQDDLRTDAVNNPEDIGTIFTWQHLL